MTGSSDNNENGAVGGRLKSVSKDLEYAISLCREGMSDVQKSYVLQREAKQFADLGQFSSAVDILSYAINLNHVVPFFTMRASCYQKLQKWTEAYFDYCFAIQMEPETGSHYSMRGMCLGKLKKIDMALEDLTLACKFEPIAHNYITRSTLHMDNRDFESAVCDCNKALALIENNSKMKEDDRDSLTSLALFRRAQAYHETQMYEQEISDLISVVTQDVHSVAPRILLTRAYKMTGDLHAAEKEASNAILMHPDFFGYMERGDIRFRLGINAKSIEAIDDFTKCIDLMEDKEEQLTQQEKDRFRGVVKSHESVSHKTIITGTSDEKFSSGSSADVVEILEEKSLKSAAAHTSENSSETALRHVSRFQIQEEKITSQKLVELKAEIYAKRSRTILMLDHQDEEDLHRALEDAKKASTIAPSNKDHRLLVGLCFIRLQRMGVATTVIGKVTEMYPDSEYGLFCEAFCYRLDGNYEKAIDNLTKILSLREKMSVDTGENDDQNVSKKHSVDFDSNIFSRDSMYSLPMHVIYENRGILFHQGMAYKLALSDLSKAILLNPEKAATYFLRADCFSKLGSYEKALWDFRTAEEKGFEDVFSLLNCRGTVWRCLGDIKQAELDFRRALNLVESSESDESVAHDESSNSVTAQEVDRSKDDENIGHGSNTVKMYSHIRALNFHALCLYDLKKYPESFVELQKALKIVKCLMKSSKKEQSISPASTLPTKTTPNLPAKERLAIRRREKDGLSGRLKSRNDGSEIRNPNFDFMKNEISPDDLGLDTMKKIEWTICFHLAGCLHSLSRLEESGIYLRHILQKISNSFPDQLALGVALFFYGIQCSKAERWTEAEGSFRSCLHTLWAENSMDNMCLCKFGLGKALQGQGRHEEAINEFNYVISKNSGDAHCYFRRAWSFKALGSFNEAADDFERAKSLKPNDPNFAVVYKNVHKVEFLELNSEPDLLVEFPTLLSRDNKL